MRLTPLLLCVLVAVPLFGCPKRATTVSSQLEALLAEADRAWDRRGVGGFQPVDDALQKAFGLVPDDPGVLWRLTRLRVAEAQVEDDPERRLAGLGQARSLAWGCVQGDLGTAAVRAEQGMVRALERMPPERQPCVAWGGYAWARWMVEFGGEAASLDLEMLDAIARAGAGYGEASRVRVAWAEGIVAAGRPEWADRDVATASTRFAEVERALQGELEVRVDRFVLLQRGTPDETAGRAALAGVRPNTPEERAVLRRALDQRP